MLQCADCKVTFIVPRCGRNVKGEFDVVESVDCKVDRIFAKTRLEGKWSCEQGMCG